MSIRFVYTPRFVGVSLNATKQTLAMAKHAATRRLNAIVTATRAQKTLTDLTATGSFGSSFDFYISPTGTGTAAGGGSFADPWDIAMLRNATAQARYAGSRVGLLDGSYPIPTTYTDFSAPYWDVAGGTNDSNRTIIESVNPRGAVLDGLVGGSGSTYAAQAIIGTSNQYVTFKNLTVKRASSKLMQILNHNVTVEGCEIYDLNNQRAGGVAGDNCDLIRVEGNSGRLTGIVIRNNKLHDVAHSAAGTWQTSNHNAAGVKLYDVDGCIYEYNTSYNCGSGFFSKSNSKDNVVRYNFGYSSISFVHGIGAATGWSGGTIGDSVNNVYQNVAVNCTFFNDSNEQCLQQVHLYNNTYYGQSPNSATYVLTFRPPVTSNVFDYKNNIFWLTTSSGGGLVYDEGSGANAISCINGATTNYNLYPGTLRWANGTYTTLAAWRTAVGGEANSATTNPNFVSAGTLTAESYKISGAALTASDVGGPVGAYITGSEQIGCDF
jgi:hypothetical protein